MAEDDRWCEGGDDRYGEFGVIGAEQGDEEHYDDRENVLDQDGRLKFSKKKLYGRDEELEQLHGFYDRLLGKEHEGAPEDKKGNITPSSSSSHKNSREPSSSPWSSEIVFITGYSGSGKSTLVLEFENQLKRRNVPHALVEGKYSQSQTAAPFSAICDALDRWCAALSEEDRKELYTKWQGFQDSIGHDAVVLIDLMPRLSKLVKSPSKICRAAKRAKDVKSNKASLMHAFQSFLQCLCTPEKPFILFIDDLQWADEGSLDLYSSLLKNRELKHIMFVMAYRFNEVNDDHLLSGLIADVKEKRKINTIKLKHLSETDVAEFIADTLGFDEMGEVHDFSEAIFMKTLGNIFFTMQAMEQLVRKNALFYDMMTFSWQWNLSKEGFENELSGDILEMVESKLRHKPKMMQDVLAIASYVRNKFDVFTLLFVTKESEHLKLMTKANLVKILDEAVFEGILTKDGKEKYSFAQDRFQEVAMFLVEEKNHDQILFCVGNSLKKLYALDEFSEDWMLFTAVAHLNSLKIDSQDKDAKISLAKLNFEVAKLSLAKLNLEAAKLSINVAGFHQASKLLRSGVACLDKEIRWNDSLYDFTLEILQLSLDVESGVGNFDLVQKYCEEILTNAKTLKDQAPAYGHLLYTIANQMDQNSDLAITKGIEILNIFSIKLPLPDDVQQSKLEEAEKCCKAALAGRTEIDLLESSPIEDDSVMIILDILVKIGISSGKFSFVYLISLIATRICAEDGISKHLSRIFVSTYFYHQIVKNDIRRAYNVAVASKEMATELMPDKDAYFTIMNIHNMMVLNFQPIHNTLQLNDSIAQQAFQCGADHAYVASYYKGWCHIFAGVPLTVLAEAKLTVGENRCRDRNQRPSIFVFFMIARQYSLNMRGMSENPFAFNGRAMTEESALGLLEQDSTPYKQTLRDLNICKLIISCVYGDLTTIVSIIESLKTWPLKDQMQPRHYCRLLFVAMGAFMLSRRMKETEYLELGKEYLDFFSVAAGKGNPNARVAFLCLEAENCETHKNYDAAIHACRELRFMHLEAIMNEHCGLYMHGRKLGIWHRTSIFYSKQKKRTDADTYLKSAMGLYIAYGAAVKVKQMKLAHPCLEE